MRRFAVSVIALVLAVGLSSAVPKPEVEISNYPIYIDDVLESEGIARPVPSIPGFAPETDPVFELDPVLENEDITAPVLISLNPCDACFEYMTTLIDQLTEVTVPEVPVHPEIEVVPEVPEVGLPSPIPVVPEVGLPSPIPVVPEDGELRPLPLPVSPEVEVIPMPAPVLSEAEAEEALASQGRPLPTYIIRK